MSKHHSRRSRWVQINAKEYRSTFGVVRYHAGAWEGAVQYEEWLAEEEHPAWVARTAAAGRFKRPRNAMIGVEEKARDTARRLKERGRVAFAP